MFLCTFSRFHIFYRFYSISCFSYISMPSIRKTITCMPRDFPLPPSGLARAILNIERNGGIRERECSIMDLTRHGPITQRISCRVWFSLFPTFGLPSPFPSTDLIRMCMGALLLYNMNLNSLGASTATTENTVSQGVVTRKVRPVMGSRRVQKRPHSRQSQSLLRCAVSASLMLISKIALCGWCAISYPRVVKRSLRIFKR